MWGYILTQKLQNERSKSFTPSPINCKPSPSGVSLESPELENFAQVSEFGPEVGQKHDTRKAVSATLSV